MTEYTMQVSPVGADEYRQLYVTLPGDLWDAICDEAHWRKVGVAPSDMLAALVMEGLGEMRKSVTHEQMVRANAREYMKSRLDHMHPEEDR